MFGRLREFWNDYGFIILIGITGLFILIVWIIRLCTGKRGNWGRHTRPSWDKLGELIAPSLMLGKGKTGRGGGHVSSVHPYSSFSGRKGPPKESKGEKECRRVLETLFKRPFPNVRPNFLNNPVTGGDNNLELDCYNEELKLCCEASGRQHYEYVPFFHKNKEAFYNQKYRDEMKRMKCKENGVTLIEVPYTVKPEDIERYLIDELRKHGYKV